MICVEDVPVTLLIPQKLHDQVCIQHEGSALTNVNSSQLAEEALFSGLDQHLLIVIPARSPGETENRELLLSCRYFAFICQHAARPCNGHRCSIAILKALTCAPPACPSPSHGLPDARTTFSSNPLIITAPAPGTLFPTVQL